MSQRRYVAFAPVGDKRVSDEARPFSREELEAILADPWAVEGLSNSESSMLRLLATARSGLEDRERAIKAQDRCDALELELVDLRLDRDRLDWLQQQDRADIRAWAWVGRDSDEGWTIADATLSLDKAEWKGDGPTLRAAIDMARAELPTPQAEALK